MLIICLKIYFKWDLANYIFTVFIFYMKILPININTINIKRNTAKIDVSIADKEKEHVSAAHILNCLNIKSNYNLAFTGSTRAFYAISSDGDYQKFTDRAAAQNTLSLAKTNIAECLQGKRLATHGYGFVYADEIETQDENGNCIVDEDKLNAKIMQINTASKENTSSPVYAIDEDGKHKKYPSKYKASKELGVTHPHIIGCINKTLHKTGGYTFVLPEEIETVDENGNITVDRKKLQQIVYAAFGENNSTPVYAINEHGMYKRYSGIRKAAQELNLEPANISRCLGGRQKRVGNYAFVKAQDVEITDENNRVSVDKKKIRELNQDSLVRERYVPVYVISSDGKFTRYDSKNQAAKAIGIEVHDINHCLKGRFNTFKGYAFALASDFELMDKAGKKGINYDLLKRKLEDINKNAVYAIKKDGSYIKFINQNEAARQLGLNRAKISQCVRGEVTRTSEYGFVKASDVEEFNNGIITVNTKLLKRIGIELSMPQVKAVYAFNSDGTYTRYGSAKEASEKLSLNKSAVKQCLCGQQKTSGGYRFVYAENFEDIDEEGRIIVNYNKLDEISHQINPSIKRNLMKYGKIYALRGVNIKEFDNVREAARALNINEDSIIYFLKNGRNPQNGKNHIDSYVFTCECDI